MKLLHSRLLHQSIRLANGRGEDQGSGASSRDTTNAAGIEESSDDGFVMGG